MATALIVAAAVVRRLKMLQICHTIESEKK